MSTSSPFDPEHPEADDGRIEFSSTGDGHYIFENKNLVYSEEDQVQNELEIQLGEESHTDINATVLWKHVVKGRKCGNAHGGSHVFKCKHCQKIYHGTYTRVYAHLMGHKKGESKGIGYCSVVKADKNLQFQIKLEVEQVESTPNVVPLKKSKLNAAIAGATPQGPSLALSYAGSFENDSLVQDEDEVDSKIIRCLCANGIPFNVLRSPYWEEMVLALSRRQGYRSPSCERASTILLRNERVRVERELDDFKQKWSHYGISILSNGWTDIKYRHLISVIASNQYGSMFLYALDFLVVEKSHQRISHHMLEAIKKVGVHNVVQFITDNAAICKAAGEEVAKTYPSIFWTPCVVHTLNLVLKDVFKELPWLKETYLNAKGIVKYITCHFNVAEIFLKYSKLELLKTATRPCAAYYIFRLLDVRETLVAAVLSDQWEIWSGQPILDEKVKLCGASVKKGILSEDFWEAVQLARSIIKPIYKVMKFTDQEGSLIGEVCERFDNMLGELKDNLKKHEDMLMTVKEKLHSRWSRTDVPLHCLAYALTPKYYDEDFLQTPAPGGRKKCPPDQDDDIFEGAMSAICKMHPNDDHADTVRLQFLSFTERRGKFSSRTAKRDARNPKINALQWWKFHGGDTKELRDVAFRVLAQPVSASSVEKPWSTYSFIHHARRNQLNEGQKDDLMFVHSNLRLLSRSSQNYNFGLHRKWDINPEHNFADDSVCQCEEMHLLNPEENSLLSQASNAHSSIQELLRIIEDVPSSYNQSGDGSPVNCDLRVCGGRGVRAFGGYIMDSTGKTKKFL